MNKRTLPLLLSLIWGAVAVLPAARGTEPSKKDSGDIVFPPAPDKPRIRFLQGIKNIQDLKGRKRGGFGKLVEFLAGGETQATVVTRPYGVWVQGGFLYLTDPDGQRVVRLDLGRAEVKTYGGAGEGGFMSPVGVASDDAGNVYVADTGDHLVKALSAEGKVLWKSDGGGSAKFKRPASLGWTSAKELAVLDAGNGRIVVLSKEGKFLRELCRNMKDPFALPSPGNLWVEKGGNFIISDPLMGRVHVFTSTGGFVSGFGEIGDSAGYMARPRGVASDSDGNIYVADALFNRVQIFDRKGQLLLYFASPGTGPAQLALPAGIFIDDSDKVYVVDSKNQRVQVFQYIKYPPETKSAQ